MGLSRKLRQFDDSYEASLGRARQKSGAFDRASGQVEGLFTPHGQLRYVIPMGLAANAVMLVLGMILFVGGETIGLVLAVASVVVGGFMLFCRALMKRRLVQSRDGD